MNKKYTTGMVFGTFDLFHPGHQFYISEAKKFCKNLIVIIARDSRVQSRKGITPNNNEQLRQKNVQNFLDENFQNDRKNIAILGSEENIFAPLEKYQPEILIF